MDNLIELQEKIHAQSVKMGWWDNPQSFSTFVCLFHSELSEAMDGDRKGLVDVRLPHYPMIAVEIADFVIRVLDWFGAQDDIDIKQMITIERPLYTSTDFIAEMHQFVSAAHYFASIDGGIDQLVDNLSTSVMLASSMAKKFNWDLLKIINEKLVYDQ